MHPVLNSGFLMEAQRRKQKLRVPACRARLPGPSGASTRQTGCETGGVWKITHHPSSSSSSGCCVAVGARCYFRRGFIQAAAARKPPLSRFEAFVCHRFLLLLFVFQEDDEELVLPLRPRKSPLNGLCCLTFGLVVFMASLVLASIYVYRYYFIPHVRRI